MGHRFNYMQLRWPSGVSSPARGKDSETPHQCVHCEITCRSSWFPLLSYVGSSANRREFCRGFDRFPPTRRRGVGESTDASNTNQVTKYKISVG